MTDTFNSGSAPVPVPEVVSVAAAIGVERHEIIDGEYPDCIGQWCCGCDAHPIGKPWGWNFAAWDEHRKVCPAAVSR